MANQVKSGNTASNVAPDNHGLRNDPDALLRYRDSIYASDLLLCAVAYLDFFTHLKESALTFDEICSTLNTAARPADVMLSLFMAMGLVEHEDTGHYRLTGISREYLVSDSPFSLVPYYASLQNRPQCREFLGVLRTGQPAGWSSDGANWLAAMRDKEFAGTFTAAMDSRGMFLAQKLAETIDLGDYRSLLDVAGGSGTYACALARQFKNLDATVLEIPPVDAAARSSIESKGMTGRVNVMGGDMFSNIPSGFDIHLFANTFHDWNLEAVYRLAKNSFAALPANGAICVFDAHLNDSKNGPLSIAEYSCLLMHSTEGRCYSTTEIGDVLQQAGFVRIQLSDVAADRTVIIAAKH
jgi:hypothetical protein